MAHYNIVLLTYLLTSLNKAIIGPHLEYAYAVWCPYKKGDIEIIEKVKNRATKLIISLKHISYSEILKQLQLPTLKYRRLHGDLIEVFKTVHKYYDVSAGVRLRLILILSTSTTRLTLGHKNIAGSERSNLSLSSGRLGLRPSLAASSINNP